MGVGMQDSGGAFARVTDGIRQWLRRSGSCRIRITRPCRRQLSVEAQLPINAIMLSHQQGFCQSSLPDRSGSPPFLFASSPGKPRSRFGLVWEAGCGTLICCGRLAQDRLDHVAVDVGQPEVAAGVAIDQPGVVDSHQVQDRGVVVVNVHGVFDDVHAEFVGLAVGTAALDAAAGEQGGERLGVMVAALGSGSNRSRASGRTRCRLRSRSSRTGPWLSGP